MRVAIIEDDALQEKELRTYLTKYFSELSCPIEISSFGLADEFLSSFENHKYDMIFMDI